MSSVALHILSTLNKTLLATLLIHFVMCSMVINN
jgi:hypothetical protein